LTGRVVAFGRSLREAGLRVTTGQVALFLEALEVVDVTAPRAFHDTARATLVSRHEEIDTFEAVFARFWTRVSEAPPDEARPDTMASVTPRARSVAVEAGLTRTPRAGSPAPAVDRRLTWSDVEVLRHKRFERLDTDESRRVRALMRRLSWRLDERRTRRFRRASHGKRLDWRGMAQRAVRDQGEWLQRRWRQRRTAPRPIVVLADISGSMDAYSRMLLYFLHGMTQGRAVRRGPRLEAFVFATRLTRITRALQRRDVDLALAEIAARVVDWSGGTRIGDSLHTFNRDWARRVLGRGAVVLVISDAWDRGDPDRLAREMDRLQRSCHRLIWLNPLIATAGYKPRTRGVVAALPFVDDFLPVHDLASVEDLARHLESLPPARRTRGGSAGNARRAKGII
jgi:uncharacterized protein with von Willebrand factor type A (vWA) domain